MRFLSNHERLQDGEGADHGTNNEAKRVAGGITLYAGHPQITTNDLQNDLTHEISFMGSEGLTGPKNRARETILCARPFAIPTIGRGAI